MFDEDLKEYPLTINSPNDSLLSADFTITFWWEHIIEADSYHIQIVRPSFTATEIMLLDTIMTHNMLTYTFDKKGVYAWRIRAQNNKSETPYYVRTFTIDNTIDLVEQELLIISPRADFATNANSIEFKWVALQAADDYLFSVQKDNAEGEYVVEPVLLYSNNYVLDNSISVFEEGAYFWTVQARNSLPSKTQKIERTFFVDRTSPGTPGAIFPVRDTALIIKTVNFSWERYDDGAGTNVYDSVFVLKENVSGDFEIYRRIKHTSIVTETTVTSLVSGNYRWYVQSFDMAENASQPSVIAYFSIE